jgi:hypothetical protein
VRTLQPDFDHNCNGIKGTDPQGRAYEDLYCSSTKQYGLAVFGDSVSTSSRRLLRTLQ